MSLFNEYEFKKCVDRYKGDRHAIKFNCRDQFMVMPQSTLAEANEKKDWHIYQEIEIEDSLTIAELYHERWQIELFFKWIKQHLHTKTFYGTTQNEVYAYLDSRLRLSFAHHCEEAAWPCSTSSFYL